MNAGVFLSLPCDKATRPWCLASGCGSLADVTFGRSLTPPGHTSLIEVLVPEIVIVPFPHASQNFLEVHMMLQA